MSHAENRQVLLAQENILRQLATTGVLTGVKLLGGTALARCYLQHRLSYDLDFFLPVFEPRTLLMKLQQRGIKFQTMNMFGQSSGCAQVHGVIQGINVSFIEDKLNLFPAVTRPLVDAESGLEVLTEPLDGLYHRKLVCIAGDNAASIIGRQKARDIFDIYALTRAYKSLADFIPTLPYPFPTEQFIEALVSMPWHELLPEMQGMVVERYADVSLSEMEDFLLADLAALDVPSEDEGASPC